MRKREEKGVIVHKGIGGLDSKTKIVVIERENREGKIETWVLVENTYPVGEQEKREEEVKEVYRAYKEGKYQEQEKGEWRQ